MTFPDKPRRKVQQRAPIETLCVASGVAGALALFAGWAFCARFMPPPSPALGAEAVADLYRSNAAGIKFGAILLMAASALLVPYYSAIAARIEVVAGRRPHSSAQLILGVLGICVPVALIAGLWMTAAYRPERPEQLVLLLNDAGWILLFSPVFAAWLQYAVIAAAVLGARGKEAPFPRWFAYLCLWAGSLYLPGAVLAFFMTGPFAWNGIITFGMAIVAFAVWFLPMTWLLATGRK